ncbi:PDGLE domain-containing protein [Nocardioides bruguierae]|uniref:PDGLE domain-containing protein n=1 Tax=Nocardioides bruguierae TaxID=2945102 RepID=A0A9X2D7G4_9ACTN|nr:PDGLE domain-containing protein [Nocardioides bruguierae]MCM0620449.1 PDGLE domain-containing protein [Nocardioides bruguierae]
MSTATEDRTDQAEGRPRVATRWVLAGTLLVSLLLAGVVSYYAASSPDGLEQVSQTLGFHTTETDHELSDSPFADYGTAGVSDGRLSGGIAGVAGVLIVLVLAGGLTWAVRRRRPEKDSADEASTGETAA